MVFFIEQNGKPVGPISLNQLGQYQVHKDTMVWQEGTSGWIQAEKLEIIRPFIKVTPPPLPSRYHAELSKKYDLSVPKEKQVINLGVSVFIGSLILAIVYNAVADGGSESPLSYTTEDERKSAEQTMQAVYIFGGIVALIVKGYCANLASQVAKKLNRDEAAWILAAFFFPGITLIILGNQHKLLDNK